MAKARVTKKMGLMVELPECPVCSEIMSAPIYLCESGHSLCNTCTKSLNPSICPTCRQPMTQIRSRQLETLIATACINCPYEKSGCSYITRREQIDNHVKECIYRVMKCPLGVFGVCSWSGGLKDMLDHFKNSHPQNILANLNQDVTINNISSTKDDRFVYIVPQGKYIYILTLKIDINQQLAYWVVQLIGCKKLAQQHMYEINISSLQDTKRKVTFNDYCFSDAMDTAEIFGQPQCFVLSLSFFDKFINEKMVTFNLNFKGSSVPYTSPQQSKESLKKYRGKSPSPLKRYPSSGKINNNN